MSTRVIIIGAGWNGIVTAKTYLQIDPTVDITLLESQRTIGGVWSDDNTYPELLAQQPYGAYEAADLTMDKRGQEDPSGFIPSMRIHSYLEEYATKFNVADKIRFNTTVERVQRASDGKKWELYIKETSEVLICDKLIISTGQFCLPHIPQIPSDDFTPLSFHTQFLKKHYDAIKAPEVKVVTIVGAGKSAYDAATVGLLAGKKVQWIIRKDGEGPAPFIRPLFMGRDASEAAFTPAMHALYPDPLNQGWSYRFFHSGRNKFGYWLNWAIWGFMSRTTLKPWGYDDSESMRKLKPHIVDRTLYWGTPPIYPVPREEVINEVKKGERVTVHRASITHLSGKTVHLSDDTTLQTDLLIYATGYDFHQPIFSEKDAYNLGLPVPIDHLSKYEASSNERITRTKEMDEEVLRRFPRLKDNPSTIRPAKYTQYRCYRWSVPLPLVKKNDRSLAFVGLFQGLAVGVVTEVAALWATAWLSGKMDIKREFNDVEWEVDYLNSFSRRRYGDHSKERPWQLFDWFTTIQEMTKEVGAESPNLSIWGPWFPSAYRGMVERWKESRKKND